MNRYGRDAWAYWQRWLPGRYAEINDPEAFFTNLGERVAEAVDATWERRVTDEGPPHERRAGRIERLAELKRAEIDAVLREMVFLPPEEPEKAAGAPNDPPAEAAAPAGRDEWQSRTCAALIERRITVDDLSDADLGEVIGYASPHFLLALGTSVEEQRARGRAV